MEQKQVIVIGAGAAGLMAARQLLLAGHKVTLIEARERAGGRIYTVIEPGFSKPVELGAEFVHGNLPITLGLLKQYKIPYHKVTGKMIQVRAHREKQGGGIFEYSALLEKYLNQVEQDVSAEVFMNTYFAEQKYENFRSSLKGFMQGYDAADISRASILKFRDEWLAEDEAQYRIEGGYVKLIDAMVAECEMHGLALHLSAPVYKVDWKPGNVKVHCSGGKIYEGQQAVITIPLALLQAEKGSEGSIEFNPGMPGKRAAALILGNGHVIKIVMQFREAFWESDAIQKVMGQSLKKMGFIISDAQIPTWWTQLPDKTPILTGWAGGPPTTGLIAAGEGAILNAAFHSLATIFKQERSFIEQQLIASRFLMWDKEPFSRGAYTYAVVNDDTYKNILGEPAQNTLFFAGTTLYYKAATGTVEAALESGMNVAKKIMS
jgi:monoamine oxidase